MENTSDQNSSTDKVQHGWISRKQRDFPSRHSQNEDFPNQEDSKIRKKRLVDPEREIEKLKRQFNRKSIFHRFLFYLLYFTFSAVVLYLWFNKEVFNYYLIQVQLFFSSPLDTFLLFLILFLSLFRYPLYRSTSTSISFRPIDLQWKITYAVEIHASKDKLPRLTTVLKNIPHITFYQLNDIKEETNTLVTTATRRIFPLGFGPSKLRSMVNTLLKSTNVVFSSARIPDIRFQRFHMIKTSNLYLQLDTLVRQLQRNEVTGQLITITRKNRDFINDEDLTIDTIYDLYVGFTSPDLDQWMGLMNSISKDVKHRPYPFFFCNRYVPKLWAILTRIMRFPGISWFVELRARNEVYLRKVQQAFAFPRYDHHSEQIYNFTPPNISLNFNYTLGKMVAQGVQTKDFGIRLDDLAQGGIISGAIGTGKTTLRLHLMHMAIRAGLRVIDFDLKGDATRYAELMSAGKVVIPNRNYHLNPFNCPNGFKEREYANILLQSFVETIPSGDELSPPQLHLLTRAIYKTVEEKGNARSFFKNLYVLGHQEQQFIDNKQENTAQAVITRFNWMQTVMHDIFWQSKSSLLITDYERTSLFFDLSELEMTATRPQVRFLINLIMARVTASMRNRKESRLSDVIFLDETQILMPRRRDMSDMTKLEQTVTTLRYKGVSVIAAGVSAAMMSPVLLDVGFVAQFRSESDVLKRALGITPDEVEKGLIAQLPRFHALIRSNSIGSRPIMAKIKKFEGTEVIPDVGLPDATPLAKFELDFDNIWSSKLDSIILPYIDLTAYLKRDLRRLAMKFVKREFDGFEFKESEIIAAIDHGYQRLRKLISSQAIDHTVVRYTRDFLLFVVYYYFLGLVDQLKYDSKLNLVRKNLASLVNTAVQHVLQLEIDSEATVFDEELAQLRAYIAQIEEFQQLDREDLNALTVEIAAQLEKLARKLGIETMGLSAYIAEMTAAGWLTPQQHALLVDFNRKIRNPIVHGTYLYKTTDVTLIYRSARLTVSLVEQYRDFARTSCLDEDTTPDRPSDHSQGPSQSSPSDASAGTNEAGEGSAGNASDSVNTASNPPPKKPDFLQRWKTHLDELLAEYITVSDYERRELQIFARRYVKNNPVDYIFDEEHIMAYIKQGRADLDSWAERYFIVERFPSQFLLYLLYFYTLEAITKARDTALFDTIRTQYRLILSNIAESITAFANLDTPHVSDSPNATNSRRSRDPPKASSPNSSSVSSSSSSSPRSAKIPPSPPSNSTNSSPSSPSSPPPSPGSTSPGSVTPPSSAPPAPSSSPSSSRTSSSSEDTNGVYESNRSHSSPAASKTDKSSHNSSKSSQSSDSSSSSKPSKFFKFASSSVSAPPSPSKHKSTKVQRSRSSSDLPPTVNSPATAIDNAFKALWNKRLHALILSQLHLSESVLDDLISRATDYVSSTYATYHFDVTKIMKLLSKLHQRIKRQSEPALDCSTINTHPRAFLLLVTYSYLFEVIVASRGTARLKQIENDYIVAIETLVAYIDDLMA